MIKAGRSNYNDLYNLACCYSHLGDTKLASRYLLFAVEAGFDDIDHIKDDPDFRKIKNSLEFQGIMDRCRQEVSHRKTGEEGQQSEPSLAGNSGRTSVESVSGASATVSYGNMN